MRAMLIDCLMFCLIPSCTGLRTNEPHLQHAGMSAKREFSQAECSLIPPMVAYDGGRFLMGIPDDLKGKRDYRKEDGPPHERDVRPFAIGKYLVTSEEFCRFLNEEGNRGYFWMSHVPWNDFRTLKFESGRYVPQEGAARSPAYPVTWYGAKAYCAWLSAKTGLAFRLPLEEEWEFAARGQELRLWPWGDKPPLDHHRDRGITTPFTAFRGERWLPLGSRSLSSRPWSCIAVGTFGLNRTPEGVYDMLGYYLGQWCEDILASYVPAADGDQPKTLRVVRGAFGAPYTGPWEFWTLLYPGDSKGSAPVAGYTWTRLGKPPNGFAHFRVAMSLEE